MLQRLSHDLGPGGRAPGRRPILLRGRDHSDRLPDRPLRPAPPGPAPAGRESPDPRRRGRRRPGRGAVRAPDRRRSLRHRGQRREAGLPALPRRCARVRLALAGICRRGAAGHGRTGSRRPAQFARRGIHPEGPRRPRALRPLPRDRRARHLPEQPDRPAALRQESLLRRDRAEPADASPPEIRPRNARRNHGIFPLGRLQAAARGDLSDHPGGGRLPAHGDGEAHRQGRPLRHPAGPRAPDRRAPGRPDRGGQGRGRSGGPSGGAHEAAIAPAEGVEALARIMASGTPQVAVSSRPLQPIIDFLRGQEGGGSRGGRGQAGRPQALPAAGPGERLRPARPPRPRRRSRRSGRT